MQKNHFLLLKKIQKIPKASWNSVHIQPCIQIKLIQLNSTFQIVF